MRGSHFSIRGNQTNMIVKCKKGHRTERFGSGLYQHQDPSFNCEECKTMDERKATRNRILLGLFFALLILALVGMVVVLAQEAIKEKTILKDTADFTISKEIDRYAYESKTGEPRDILEIYGEIERAKK